MLHGNASHPVGSKPKESQTMSVIQQEVATDAMHRVENMLIRANGRRRERIVPLNTVLGMIRRFGPDSRWSACDGGSVANSYNFPAATTVILLARVQGRIFLGIATASAKATSPGRAWSCLQPWKHDEGPRGDVEAKWAEWTRQPNVIELTDPEIDSIKSED
jgi:hypothetical protein